MSTILRLNSNCFRSHVVLKNDLIKLQKQINIFQNNNQYRWKTTSSSSTTTTIPIVESTATATGATAANNTTAGMSKQELHREYLRYANKEMQKYHETRELLLKGKIVKLRDSNHTFSNKQMGIQAGIFGIFIIIFLSTPLIGKKIAQDEEFRKKYIPSWYDYTLPKQEGAWTREEIHESLIKVQNDLRQRTINGEFTPENIEYMKNNNTLSIKNKDDVTRYFNEKNKIPITENDEAKYYPHRVNIKRNKMHDVWDKIHPGLDDDEDPNEE